jgi:hypothetical protein
MSDETPFRRGFDTLRRVQEEDEVNLAHDLIVIRHRVDEVGWPPAATRFVHRLLELFPDPDDEDDNERPDWDASELLAYIIHDLAHALENP